LNFLHFDEKYKYFANFVYVLFTCWLAQIWKIVTGKDVQVAQESGAVKGSH